MNKFSYLAYNGDAQMAMPMASFPKNPSIHSPTKIVVMLNFSDEKMMESVDSWILSIASVVMDRHEKSGLNFRRLDGLIRVDVGYFMTRENGQLIVEFSDDFAKTLNALPFDQFIHCLIQLENHSEYLSAVICSRCKRGALGQWSVGWRHFRTIAHYRLLNHLFKKNLSISLSFILDSGLDVSFSKREGCFTRCLKDVHQAATMSVEFSNEFMNEKKQSWDGRTRALLEEMDAEFMMNGKIDDIDSYHGKAVGSEGEQTRFLPDPHFVVSAARMKPSKCLAFFSCLKDKYHAAIFLSEITMISVLKDLEVVDDESMKYEEIFFDLILVVYERFKRWHKNGIIDNAFPNQDTVILKKVLGLLE